MRKPRVLVLTGFGLNCDHETAYAFELAGSTATRVHINALIEGSVRLADYQMLAFVGGFSWGDDHGAGVIQAIRLKTNIGDHLMGFIESGKLIIGICNGFQTMVNLGLLPGIDGDYKERSVALTYNDCGNFRDDWVTLHVDSSSPCVFTQGLDSLELPIRHGEGKFFAEGDTIKRLFSDHQVVMQYALNNGQRAEGLYPFNPNGSVADIAGICDPTGRVFGLMPHPEAYNHWTNHPDWSRQKEMCRRQGQALGHEMTPGTRIFQNAVEYVLNN